MLWHASRFPVPAGCRPDTLREVASCVPYAASMAWAHVDVGGFLCVHMKLCASRLRREGMQKRYGAPKTQKVSVSMGPIAPIGSSPLSENGALPTNEKVEAPFPPKREASFHCRYASKCFYASNLEGPPPRLRTPIAVVVEGRHLIVRILDMDQTSAFTCGRSVPSATRTLLVPLMMLVGPTPEDEPLILHFPAPVASPP